MRCGVLLLLLARDLAVSAEESCGGELAEAVSDHVFGHEDVDEGLAVMDGEGLSDEFGKDGGASAPGLDGVLLAALCCRLRLLQEGVVNKRSFLDTSGHLLLPPGDDEVAGLLLWIACLEAL